MSYISDLCNIKIKSKTLFVGMAAVLASQLFGQSLVFAVDVDPIPTVDIVPTAEIAVPAPCVAGASWMATSPSSSQGTKNDGSAITDVTRTNPTFATGAANGNFFSLGKNGSIILKSSGYVLNVAGNDLSFHEITNGRSSYPEEKATVEVSQDGTTWFSAGSATGLDTDGISYVDFNSTGLPWVQYVRVTDNTDFTIHAEDADGYDLDAVDITTQTCAEVTLSKSGVYDSTTGNINYTIHWAVVGTGSVSSLTITDVVPAGTTYVAASASAPGTYDLGLNTLEWILGSQSAGSSGDVTFQATVNAASSINQYASLVISSTQGLQSDLTTAVDPTRSNPTFALGAPQSLGGLYDNPVTPSSFYSLGFYQTPDGGSITLAFDHPVYNGTGADFSIYEVTGGDNYPDETARVEISDDNSIWTNVGVVVRDGTLDLGVAPSANFVRITGTSDIAQFQTDADNFDVDAVKAIHKLPKVCSIDNTANVAWADTAIELNFSGSAKTTTIVNRSTCDKGNDGLFIMGKVYNDKDSNNAFDGADEGLASWTVDLAILNDGSFSPVTTDGTDANGNYIFTGLNAGCYKVSEELQGGWSQTEPNVSAHDYFVALGGAECNFPIIGGLETMNTFDKFIGLFVNTASAAGDDQIVTVPGSAIALNFGNHATSGGGGGCTSNCGGGGGSGGGSSSGSTPTPPGRVLGDSTTETPSVPQVLGVTTELPRTGAPFSGLLLVFAVIGILLIPTVTSQLESSEESSK